MGYSQWGHKESDTTEQLSTTQHKRTRSHMPQLRTGATKEINKVKVQISFNAIAFLCKLRSSVHLFL